MSAEETFEVQFRFCGQDIHGPKDVIGFLVEILGGIGYAKGLPGFCVTFRNLSKMSRGEWI